MLTTACASQSLLTGCVVRPAEIGPGRYFVCLRQADPSQPYSLFFDNDTYKGSRQSVIREACETQVYADC